MIRTPLQAVAVAVLFLAAPMNAENERPRARQLGIRPGVHQPGPLNALTDVPGVRVGQVSVTEGEDVRTGVTAILPHGDNLFQHKVPAAIHVFNAFGKLVGSTQVQELGQIETPILLTNTLSVWDAAAALADWMLAQPENRSVRSVNPIVGETNDGYLNDIRGRHVKAEHVRRALESAASGPVTEGSVGAGTGTMAFGWKGGIGTSSRRLEIPLDGDDAEPKRFTVGVLVQTNFGGRLTVDGAPVWRTLQPPERRARNEPSDRRFVGGSCMIVVATDAPLDHRQLGRLAARAPLGMARTGSTGSHGSGDYVIAFSTANRIDASSGALREITLLDENRLNRLFEAVIEATEEAVYNSLLRATTVQGRDGHKAQAIPIDQLRAVLRAAAR